MRILYGVVGEGMGHAMRSRVVLEHLVARGHEVEIMASGRASAFLARRFEGVNEIHGLHMISEDNRVRLGRTLWSNVLAGITGVPKNIRAYFELIDGFKPEVVISDFESWTHLYAKVHDRPIYSIDNMQVINRCLHAPEILEGVRTDFEISRAFVKSKLPACDWYLITAFFRAPIRKERTSLYPPILRPEVLAARPTRGEHLLVYQTGASYDGLIDLLRETGLECRIYGMRRNIEADLIDGNLVFRPFSEQTFIDDLASCRAVIASAGFTLMGEAVYLHKPMLAFPLQRQFEQIVNGRYLEREGFGMTVEKSEGLGRLRLFLDRQAEMEEKLAGYEQRDNSELLAAVDGLLERE
ncbi:MAG TPA: MJ1255/VC2487 family glycosyltransferase [Candidatus Acidoferrum sp.]|nr:MJ1255/VC2487 family glycosyltransferase [Candidatus Acidoferrum sp.]